MEAFITSLSLVQGYALIGVIGFTGGFIGMKLMLVLDPIQ